MDKKEIINEFLCNAIKQLENEMVLHIDMCYQDDLPYDKETLDALNYEKRLLMSYL